MNKIYISNWAKGFNQVSNLNLYLIDNFVKVIKKHTPNIEIVFLTDVTTKNQVSQYVLENTTIKTVLDKYNNHKPVEWALVKLKTISEIEDEEVLHLDYDIVWKYDLNIILDAFRKSEFDVVYQKTESLMIPYYRVFFYNNKDKRGIFNGFKRRVAFNAGISYFKTKEVRSLINKWLNFSSEKFGDYVSLEQVLIPNDIERSSYKIGTLVDFIRTLPLVKNSLKFDGSQAISKEVYNELCNHCNFIQNLGFFHFSGWSKTKEGIEDTINILSEL